ncbi:hypothetical protein CC78DRAFT_30525 [Lojkania enalia]|uniref:Uncharacterized protein n=1 Tax=Lojkania enalia TaxID=147567 RepID=A0A9P4KEU0_9PLEO|nr:hypothetical protein CC78DRAFT_30525 [Didymosphaeria enalia]
MNTSNQSMAAKPQQTPQSQRAPPATPSGSALINFFENSSRMKHKIRRGTSSSTAKPIAPITNTKTSTFASSHERNAKVSQVLESPALSSNGMGQDRNRTLEIAASENHEKRRNSHQDHVAKDRPVVSPIENNMKNRGAEQNAVAKPRSKASATNDNTNHCSTEQDAGTNPHNEVRSPSKGKRRDSQQDSIEDISPTPDQSTAPKEKIKTADFVHYQANQSIYDIMAVKRFVEHVLHPDTLDLKAHLGDKPDVFAALSAYLQSVSNNLDAMINKMFCGTISRSLQALARDENTPRTFLNPDRITNKFFGEFKPGNSTLEVAEAMMNWHDGCTRGLMVEYSLKSLGIPKDTSFKEAVEEAKPLLSDASKGDKLPQGPTFPSQRKIKTAAGPRTKKPKQSVLKQESSRTLDELRGPCSSALGKKRKSLECGEKGSARFGKKRKTPQMTSALIPRGIEPGQKLPPSAYFDKKGDEEHAWLCGIKHCLGYYYNAGDRSSCPGCYTAKTDNAHRVIMDFYMPSKTSYHQPAPAGVVWTPSKPSTKNLKSSNRSHNGIAKDAYWEAMKVSNNSERARTIAARVVEEALKPKSKPVKNPEPKPTPNIVRKPKMKAIEPHPSGSNVMEHGQDIPECHYFEKKADDEEFAWRCDVSHAAGRYYMAGDVHTCPGCGSSKTGPGKKVTLDFYMLKGVHIRQEAPRELVDWHPRRPYKTKRALDGDKKVRINNLTHNQYATRKYFDVYNAGVDHEAARIFAVKEMEAWIDSKVAKDCDNNVIMSGSDSDGSDSDISDSETNGSEVSDTLVNSSPSQDIVRAEDGHLIISLIPHLEEESDGYEYVPETRENDSSDDESSSSSEEE